MESSGSRPSLWDKPRKKMNERSFAVDKVHMISVRYLEF